MLVGRVQKKGGSMWYEIRAETLVLPGQIINGWTRRLGMRMKRYTSDAAPMHDYAKRPLRPHPGPHLKDTIIHGATRGYPRRTGGVVFSAVGSTAPYAAFVDQGTSGQMAKILPPWDAGPRRHTLYDASWRPGGGAPLGPKPVKGQEARHFFDEGMARAFRYMGNRSAQVAGERGILAPGFPSVQNLGWKGFFGNTSADPAFAARLSTWRMWRMEAYANPSYQAERERRRSRAMDPEVKAQRARDRAERRREESRKRTQKHRKKNRAKDKNTAAARAADEAAFIKAMKKRYGKIDEGSVKYRNGYWYALVWKDDGSGRKTWVPIKVKAKS